MKSICKKFLRFEILAVILCALALNLARAQLQLTDYGAVPSVTKPAGDQSAANQKLDFHTDLLTGRFNYQIPIEVPPGRQGSEPAIALQYNSSGGNGWCGVGWDLDMGYIQRETRYGVPINGLSYNDSAGFVFSIAGQNGRLILASDGTYRPEINTAFLKFVYANGYWVVTDKKGRQYTFGETPNSRLDRYYLGIADMGTFKWALSKVVDPNGNRTALTYQTVKPWGRTDGGQLYLNQIDYNASINSPAIAANCTVYFTLETSDRSDIPSSCLSGGEICTSRRLQYITVYCNGSRVRQYALQYNTSSSTGRSLLSGVTEYGVDNSMAWPTLTFSYSVQAHSFQPPVVWPIQDNYSALATVDCQLIDINGDGLPDRVSRLYSSLNCVDRFNVQTNTGSGFGPVQYWSPVVNEGNQLCSGQWDTLEGYWAYNGVNYQLTALIDINGDGLPDRVMRQYSFSGYNHFQVQTNTGAGFSSIMTWEGITSANFYPVLNSSDGESCVSLLVDMNGDGLPDRVMQSSTTGQFDVQLNNKNGTFSPVTGWNNVIGTGGFYPYSPRSRDQSYVYSELMDMNGDGLPDRVLQGGVQLNNGQSAIFMQSFSSLHGWGLGSTEYPEIQDLGNGYYNKQLLDLNGDGLPDLVTIPINAYGLNANGTCSVRFNTGSGFSASSTTWTGVNTNGGDHGGLTGWWVLGSFVQFIDMNGDGLLDRVIYNAPNATTNNNSILVQINNGPFPDLMTGVNNGIGGWVAVTYTNAAHWNNSDGTRCRLAMPVYTVTSVQEGDSIRTVGTTTYSYTGGFYDTTWREFRGFAEVMETDPLGTVTYTYFLQGGGLNFSAYGEYQDSRFKAGMPWDIETYGSDGQFYRQTFNIVDQVRVDPNGVYFPYVTKSFTFDAEPSVTPRATLKQYHYDVTPDYLAASTGNLLQESDWGEVNNVTTDAYGNITFTDVPDAPVFTTYTYATLSNPNIIDKPASETVSGDSAGNNILRRTLYQYFGATGNLQEKSELVCPGTYANTFYTYDNYGNPKTITDPMSIVTTINYDSASATFLSRKYTGTLTNGFQYDPRSGDLLYTTNEQGLVTANTYDGLLRLTQTRISTTPNGAPTLWRKQYQYALSGIYNLSSYNYVLKRDNDPADPNGYHQSITFFDGMGRVIQAQDEAETAGQYRLTDVFYDQRGQIIAQTYPIFAATALGFCIPSGSRTTIYTVYDPIGRPYLFYPCASSSFYNGMLWGVQPLTGDGTSPVGPTSFAFHDGNNPWAIVVTDARGKVHKYLLDAYGRTNQIVEVTSSGNYTTTLAYNQVGDLTNITDNAGNKIAMFYNLQGHQVALTDPDMGFWQYGYDLDGRLKVQTDAKGQQIKFFYNDPAGRVTRREGWNAASQLVSTNTWQYDSNAGDTPYTVYPGQVYQITDDQGWQKFSYDVRGRTLKSVRYLGSNGNSYTNQFTFDDADRLNTTIYPNGGPTVMNVYDTGLHLSQIKQVGGSGTTFYSARGFNELSQLTGVNFGNGAATTFNYYNVSKRLNQILTTAAGSTTIQNFTDRYDAVGNVVGLQDNVASHTGSASATISSAVYDDLNRLISATWSGYGQKTYGYNSIGNVLINGEFSTGAYSYGTARPHMVKSVAGFINYTYDGNGNMVYRGGQLLSYDVNNHLAQVTATNGIVTTFGYDAGGARLWEQTGTNSLQVWMGNNYEEKNGQILYHVLANGQTVVTFDKTGTNVFEYYHPDYLTSTSLQTDQNGNQVQHYEYTAFGQTRYTGSSTAFPVSRRYTGQILDDATGLYYYNARYYDPVLARFTQPDDIIPNFADPQSYNRYSYCVNNPLRFTDPSGKWGQEVADAWSGAVNTAFEYYTAGSQSTTLIGTLGTVNSLVGGVTEPLRFGTDAGHVSAEGGSAGKIALTGITEISRAAALIPVGAAIGKGAGTLLGAGEKAAAGKVASQAGAAAKPQFSGTEKPWKEGATPNSTYTHIDPKTGKAVQNATYDSDGKVISHVDFKNHGPGAPSGHGHTFPEPGNPASGHGPGKPHIPNNQLPAGSDKLPPGIQPKTPIGQ
jgi:RHS repeat-associated protein